MTKAERNLIALALRAARPPTLPGTNFVPNAVARKVWYDCVTNVSKVALPKSGKGSSEWFDTAGVPD